MYLHAKPTKPATGASYAARIVTNTKKFHHVTPVLREFQWSSVRVSWNYVMSHFSTRYVTMALRLLPKRSDTHSRSTRHKDQLQSPFCRTATAQLSFFYRAINIWNSLRLNS